MTLLRGLALLAGSVALAPAQAVDLQFHGFGAQTALHTEGNNAFGEERSPSLEFYEVGGFVTAQLTPRLLGSAQAFVGDSGENDDGKLRLDYALLDYQFLATREITLGARGGRVKNPFGLFNDTRDIIFLRPGILLPQAVYLDRIGIRDVMFSSDGGQLYGSWASSEQVTSVVLGAGLNREGDKRFRRNLGISGIDALDIEDFYTARVLTDWTGLALRTGVSYLGAKLFARTDSGFNFDLNADLWALSLQWLQPQFNVTAEYSLLSTRFNTPQGGGRSRSDGLYVQLEWLLDGRFSAFGRYDLYYEDRNDRSGRDHADRTGQPRHTQFSRDVTVGGHWRLDPHWGVWTEAHFVDGTAAARNNQDRRWEMFLVSVAFQF